MDNGSRLRNPDKRAGNGNIGSHDDSLEGQDKMEVINKGVRESREREQGERTERERRAGSRSAMNKRQDH